MVDESKVSSHTVVPANAGGMGAAVVRHPSPQSRTSAGASREQRPGGNRKYFRRKKVCKFQTEKIDHISYRDVRLLQQFISERGKILPRRVTGTSAFFQRKLTKAIKQARNIALLPFASRS